MQGRVPPLPSLVPPRAVLPEAVSAASSCPTVQPSECTHSVRVHKWWCSLHTSYTLLVFTKILCV